jgi:hypothetical protein
VEEELVYTYFVEIDGKRYEFECESPTFGEGVSSAEVYDYFRSVGDYSANALVNEIVSINKGETESATLYDITVDGTSLADMKLVYNVGFTKEAAMALAEMLYELTGHNDKLVAQWQNSLKAEGKYTVNDEVMASLKELFWGGYCTEEQTAATISETLDKYCYLIDTHTAVAVSVYNDYKASTGDERPVVIASTASPYKFANSVLEAIGQQVPENEFDAVKLLSEKTDTQIPAPIAALETAVLRFENVCEKEDMSKVVLDRLGIKA